MIVVDSSALIAILLQEESARAAAEALDQASARFLSAANWLEAAIVIETRKGAPGAIEFDGLIEAAAIAIAPVTDDVARAARTAWRRYGKSRHPASLNYGDCFAYGLAKAKGLPLLAVGGDFAKTDIALVIE